MRIVRLANFVTERSGGLRTALGQLGIGYRQAGHEAVLIVPGERASDEMTGQGRVITLAGPKVPAMGGYRALIDRRRVARYPWSAAVAGFLDAHQSTSAAAGLRKKIRSA